MTDDSNSTRRGSLPYTDVKVTVKTVVGKSDSYMKKL